MCHGINRHRAAVRPAPNRHAVPIQLRILRKKLIQRGELILQFDRAKLMPDRSLELTIAPRRPAVVDGKDGETFSDQNLIEEFARAAPALKHHLPGRATVYVHDQRDLATGRRVRRQEQTPIESAAVVRFEL